MSFAPFVLHNIDEPVLLHTDHKKFWEISFDCKHFDFLCNSEANQYTVKIRCGRFLKDGTQDLTTQEIHEKQFEASDTLNSEELSKKKMEAKAYIEKHVNIKLQKGYQYFEEKNGISKSPQNDLQSRQSEPPNQIRRKAEDPLSREDDYKRMKMNDPVIKADSFDLQETLQKIKEQEAVESQMVYSIQKEIKLNKAPDPFLSKIEQKAQELEIFFDLNQKSIFAVGTSKNIENFEKFLHSLFEEEEKEEEKGNFMQIQIPFPAILKPKKDEILAKADVLEIIHEYASDNIVVAGYSSRIEEFKKFMKEKEIQTQTQKFDPSIQPRDLKRAQSITEVSQRIILSTSVIEQKPQIEQKAQELGLKCTFKQKQVNVEGEMEQFEALGAFVLNIEQKSAEQKRAAFLSKQIPISDNLKLQFGGVEEKAKDLDLICYLVGTKVQTAGEAGMITEFLLWLLDKESKKTTVIEFDDGGNPGEYIQKEINISTFHRGKKSDIEKRAQEMELVIDFGYDIILTSGYEKRINAFVKYLYDVEANGKKALYPKNWDFYEMQKFSQTEIKQGSEEFKEVADSFHKTMPNAQMVKIERIQNRYLMDHYINMIQKRQELHPDMPVRRLMLFHGTRTTEPDKIYKSFDTGFDLQYAAHGAYGKGIYFAVNASYSHGFAHHLQNKPGHCQMLVADVFIGKAYKYKSGNAGFIKAPDGYDCVNAVQAGFYILYNNFHSYPLYLLEYRVQNNNGMVNNPMIMPMNNYGAGGLFGNQYPLGGSMFNRQPVLFNNFNNNYNNNNYNDDDDEDDEDYDEEDVSE